GRQGGHGSGLRAAVDGDHDDGPGTGPVRDGGVRVEDVVARVVLRPVGGLTEGQFVGGPRVRLTRGDHQHVAGGAARVQQQVHGLLGGVERPLRRGRDQLDLGGGGCGGGRAGRTRLGRGGRGCRPAPRRRCGPVRSGAAGTRRSRGAGTGDGAGGRRGGAGGAGGGGGGRGGRRGLGRRGGPVRAGGGGTRRRRGAGPGYGAGGRRGAAAGRRDAGTLGTLVNLRLLGNERHGLFFIKRW